MRNYKKKITVLFNTYPVAFDCPGGGEVQLQQCRAALEKRGVRVVLYDQWSPQFEQVDVVHYFSTQGWAAPFCRYAKHLGKPVVVSPILWLGENKYDYDLAGIGAVLKECDLVLPNSKAEGDRLADWYHLPREKFSPIVNGVHDNFFIPGDASLFREHYNVQGPFLLNIGNIEPRKNQLRLIQASRDSAASVVLFGRIRDAEYWNACQSVMHEGVRYLGAIEFSSPLHLSALAACQAFVLPSLLETPGLAALEAAAQGAPICITQEGCTEEYFGDHAIYVNPESEESIRKGCLAVVRQSRSKQLCQLVQSRYTWDISAEQLEKIYRGFLA